MSQYQTTKLPRLFIVAAWCALGFIIFVTLSPIGLRPGTGSAGLERFVAYYLLGSVFVAAYPRALHARYDVHSHRGHLT
jgi:hypothetical protein